MLCCVLDYCIHCYQQDLSIGSRECRECQFVCVMCFNVCVSVVSCRKITHTLVSSCDLFPIDSLISLSIYVHAHMHISVCGLFFVCAYLCVFALCVLRFHNNVDNISTSEALRCWQNTLSDLEPGCNECNSEARTV